MRTGIRTAGLFPIVVAATLIGFGASVAEDVQDDAAAQAASVPAQVPDEAKWVNNPREATPESIGNGKTIYASQCTMCHGKTGDGKGDLAARLDYAVPDFTSVETQKTRTDGELFYILTTGHAKMSGEGDRLSEDVRWDLVNYLRTLAPSSGG